MACGNGIGWAVAMDENGNIGGRRSNSVEDI